MMKHTTLALAILLALGLWATSPAAQTISDCGEVTDPGTYTVTTNITAEPDTNCITISASEVAIDLQGHTISGSGFSSGIFGRGGQNIIIANGTITGFNQNINLEADFVTISNITAVNAGFSGITNNSGNNTVVTDTQANNNGLFGIYFYGNNNTVSGSTADNNGHYGIAFLQQSATNTVINSTAHDNGLGGMFFANGNSTVIDSTANANTSDGIFIGGSNNVLTGNTTTGNTSQGISVVCPSNLNGNTAQDNPGGNIVTLGTGCVLLNNDDQDPEAVGLQGQAQRLVRKRLAQRGSVR
jgi:parallel beta-helix repeat protein